MYLPVTEPLIVCVFVCVAVYMNVCLAASLTRTQLFTQRRQHQKRQCHTDVTFTVTASNRRVCSAVTFLSTQSTHLSRSLSSLPVSLPPYDAYLTSLTPCLASPLPVCLSASLLQESGLRRPVSFIKRKQAGEITKDARMRTAKLLATSLRL